MYVLSELVITTSSHLDGILFIHSDPRHALDGITPERVELFGHRLSGLVGRSFLSAARFGQAWRSAAFAC